MDFIKSKEMYYQARKEERNSISNYYKKHPEFELEKPAARQGSAKYKSGNRFIQEYDLRNWQWVCVKRKGVHFFISLQAFDRDSKTGNFHVLMDRIGIYAYVGSYSATDALSKMFITNIELPLNEEKLHDLTNIMIDLSECEIFKLQAEMEKVLEKNGLIVSS